jgi:hypothetical protein
VNEQHAIVFGASRSGTTFLMSVLEALPEAECVTGNLWPIALAHLAAQPLPDETRSLLERSMRGAFRDYMASAVYASRPAALRKWWTASRDPRGLRDAARGIRHERVLVYKEPFLSFSPDLAFDALPGCRMIYLVRDGRDVADSMIRKYDILTDGRLASQENNEAPLGRRVGDLYVPWWVESGREETFLGADPYVRAIWMWSELNRRCERFLARPDVRDSGRVLEVRYERLMADPVGEGEALIEHLGMRIGKRAKARLEEGHLRSHGIHRRRDAAQVELAEEVAGGQLRRLGYAPGQPSTSAA